MRLLAAACERRDAVFTLKDPAIQVLRDTFGLGATSAGMNVSEASVEGIPVVFACLGLLSDIIADTPIKVMRNLPRGKAPDPRHPLYVLLHDLPNPLMDAMDFKSLMQWNLGAWGNAYAWVERYPQGDVKALWPMMPQHVTVDFDKTGRLRYTHRPTSGSSESWIWDYRRPPVFHLRVYSRDGIHGRSPVQVLREAFGSALAVREFGARFFGNDALPGVVIMHPGRLKPQAKENLRDSWKERFGGPTKAHGVAVLEEGIKIEKLTIPPNDAQFLETQRWSIEDLSRIYRVPPFLVNMTEKSTTWGSGLEQQTLGFLKFTARPWMGRWEKAAKRDLLSIKSFETHEALFVTQALERADLQTRVDAYETQIKIGMLSPNEARELEDMNPREGGDGYVNVESITQGGLSPEGRPAPEPEPEPAPDEEPAP